jgi:uncharacterized protein
MPKDFYMLALQEADKKKCDNVKVIEFLQKGIEVRDERAIYARASCFTDGKFDSEICRKKALYLFRKLEESNLPEGIFALAYCYDVGEGVKENKNKAFSLYMRAALLGHSESNWQISEFFREGSIVLHDKKISLAWKNRSKANETLISPAWRVWLRP